jgi:hypothetical protein
MFRVLSIAFVLALLVGCGQDKKSTATPPADSKKGGSAGGPPGGMPPGPVPAEGTPHGTLPTGKH